MLIVIIIIFINSASLEGGLYIIGRETRATRTSCTESNRTIEVVKSCPKDRESWEERSRVKNCRNVAQSCSNSDFVYHCVLDEFGKQLIEVCTVTTNVIGRSCAEFNTGALFIQEHFEKGCKKCPFIYKSNMSYLYNECSELADSTVRSTTEGTAGSFAGTTFPFVSSSIVYEHNHSWYEKAIEENDNDLTSTFIVVGMGILIPFVTLITLSRLKLNGFCSKIAGTTPSENFPSNENGKEGDECARDGMSTLLITQTEEVDSEGWHSEDEDAIELLIATKVEAYPEKDTSLCWIEDDDDDATDYFSAIMEKVRKQPYTLFVGETTLGITSMTRYVAKTLSGEGYEVIPVQDITELQTHFRDLHKPQVFVINDVEKAKEGYLSDYTKILQNVNTRKSKLVLSCKKVLFDEDFKDVFTNKQNVIKLSSSKQRLVSDDKKDRIF